MLETRTKEKGIYRRRECFNLHVFTTVEKLIPDKVKDRRGYLFAERAARRQIRLAYTKAIIESALPTRELAKIHKLSTSRVKEIRSGKLRRRPPK